jgi:hypothetical protein
VGVRGWEEAKVESAEKGTKMPRAELVQWLKATTELAKWDANY